MNAQVVAQKIQIASAVLRVAQDHREEILTPWMRRLFPDAHTPPSFDAGDVLDKHIALLERTCDAISRAYEANLAEASDDQAYRDARDAQAAALARVIQDSRSLLDAAYGANILEPYGLAHDPPTAGDALAPYTERAIHALRTRALQERSPFGFDLDLEPIALRLERQLNTLRAALNEVRREADELRQTLDALRQALAAFDEVYTAVSELVHALCLLARRPDLATLLQR